MTLERDIDVLRRVPLFAGLGAEPLRLLAFSADNREFPDGAVIFREREPADCAYILMEGRIDLIRERIQSKVVLASLGPASLMGELALIVDTTRPAKAVAVGRVRTQMIRRSSFRRVLEEYPQLALTLRNEIAARLAELNPSIGDLATQFGRIDKS